MVKVEVFDKSNLTFLNPKERYLRFINIEYNRTLNAEDTLDFTIPYIDYKTIQNEDFVEYKGIYFIVKNVDVVRDSTGRYVSVKCVHIKQLLLDKILTIKDGETWLPGKTIREVLERILIGTPFTIGTVDDFGTWDIEIGDRNALEVLNELLENWNSEDPIVIPNNPINSIINLSLTNNENIIGITWEDPKDTDWFGTKILVNLEREPRNENDGVELINSTRRNAYRANPFKYEANYNQSYYIKSFPYDDQENYNRTSNCVSIILTQDTQDVTPPSLVNNLVCNYNADNKSVEITYYDPTDNDWYCTVICKKIGSVPTNHEDGEIIRSYKKNQHQTTPYLDKVSNNTTYYYKAFTIDKVGNINNNGNAIKIVTPKEEIPNIDTIPSDAIISSISSEINDQVNIFLNIIDSADNWVGTKVVRNDNHYPISPTDGVLVVDNKIKDKYKTTKLIDTLPKINGTIYYKTFPYNNIGVNKTSGVNSIKIEIPITECLTGTIQANSISHKDDTLLINWGDPTDSYWRKTKLNIKFGNELVHSNEFTTKNMHSISPYKIKVEFNKTYTIEFITYDLNGRSKMVTETYNIIDNDTLPPDSITIAESFVSDAKVYFTWTDSIKTDWSGTKLIRNTNRYPINIDDGELIIDSKIKNNYKTEPFVDTNVEKGMIYYYKLFPYDLAGNANTNSRAFLIEIPNKVDTIPPRNITNLQITNKTNMVYLTWNDSDDLDWAGVKVIKKIGSAPSNDLDGELLQDIIIRNKYVTNPLVDNINFDEKTYYGIFGYDVSGNINTNYNNVISITIKSSESETSTPDPVQNVDFNNNIKGIYLKFQDPADYNWIKTIVYRKEIKEV